LRKISLMKKEVSRFVGGRRGKGEPNRRKGDKNNRSRSTGEFRPPKDQGVSACSVSKDKEIQGPAMDPNSIQEVQGGGTIMSKRLSLGVHYLKGKRGGNKPSSETNEREEGKNSNVMPRKGRN